MCIRDRKQGVSYQGVGRFGSTVFADGLGAHLADPIIGDQPPAFLARQLLAYILHVTLDPLWGPERTASDSVLSLMLWRAARCLEATSSL